MDGTDGVDVNFSALPERFTHRSDVACDKQSVCRRPVGKLSECDVAHAGGKSLDLGAR
ncbi:hypothetical protein [Lancefieldella rimae]|uniref:hypothetical protein n=1 Tax=Lancefieldella rimae TaxID=1383 RepID=UPI00235433AB|nr:hypothetical protein [Lancefieldella rimae]